MALTVPLPGWAADRLGMLGHHAGGQASEMPEDPVELCENGLAVTAEFVSDEGSAVSWSQGGQDQETIAVPLDNGKQKLRRSVERRLMLQIPANVVVRLVTLLAEQYPDAFDPEFTD